MKLWDWAALVPVIEGAGGRLTDWQGQALRPDGDGRVLSVGDPALLARRSLARCLTSLRVVLTLGRLNGAQQRATHELCAGWHDPLLLLGAAAAPRRRGRRARRRRTHGHRAAGHADAAAGLPALPLRQPERAEGRRGRARRRSAPSTASTRSSCAAPRGGAASCRGLVDTADCARRRRRGRDRLRPSRRDRSRSPADTAVRRLRAAAGGEVLTTARRSPPRTSPGPSTRCCEKGRPIYRAVQMADVKRRRRWKARAASCSTSSPNENRELPLILGELPVLPKHFWDGRDFTKPLTDPPLGSGPYRIGHFELGRTRHLMRVAGLVGGEPADRQGHQQFRHACASSISATRRWRWRRSRPARSIFRSENISKDWATAYDFPAVQNGLVIKQAIPPPPADRHAGLRDEHAPPGVRRSAACARRWPRRSISSGRTRTCSTAPTRARRAISATATCASSGMPAGRRAEAAGAVSRQAAAGAVHRAVQAAGDRRLRQQPRAVARSAGAAASRPAGR